MNNNGWSTKEQLKEKLVKVNKEENLNQSGIPMAYDEENLYINTSEAHTIVIGATGSGKTQATLLPQARLAIKAGESLVVNDAKGEIKEVLKEELDKNGYNIITINLDNTTEGNKYNPLSLFTKLYKENKKDKAIEVLEATARYFFSENETNENRDPFWENTAVNYFVGLALYLTDKQKKVTINDIYKLATEFTNEMLNELEKTSPVYANLAGTILAPTETKGSIISVFIQKIKLFISREGLSNLLLETNFDLENISNNRTALFIVSGPTTVASSIIPMIISQIFYIVEIYGKKEKRTNVLIDEFEKIKPIERFEIMADYSRGMKLRFTIYIKSLLELKNKYGKERSEIIKMSFGNIIYLLANDYETLGEISSMCGKIKKDNNYEQLITPEELKLLDYFEAIILIPRMRPIRTKLIPDYKINWK